MSDSEILDEIDKKACIGNAADKKKFLLDNHQLYTDFVERMILPELM